MAMTPITERFVLHWGEMGARWGMNRSVAQIHGLLYLSSKPLSADEIMAALGLARSNVSNSLKELQSWDLVRVTHIIGDRRDHFVAEQDPQEIFNRIVEGRKRREIDPTLTLLRDLSSVAQDEEPGVVQERIDQMLEFVDVMTRWYDDVKKLPNPTLLKLAKLGSKIVRMLRL